MNSIKAPLLIIIIFMMCVVADSHAYKKAPKLPCWITDLSAIEGHNVYGVARNFSASSKAPLHYAKLYAVNNWLLAHGQTKINTNKVLTDATEFDTGNQTLYFNDTFANKGNIYALVSDVKTTQPLARNCTMPKCQLAKCKPGWLCDRQTDAITVLGVSATTVHPNDPLKHMIDNAQQVSRTVNLAHVLGEVNLVNVDTSYYKSTSLQQTFKIEDLDKQVNPVKVGKMCQFKGTLISEISFQKSEVSAGQNWLETPNIGELTGAVGHAKGLTSTGRMSDLLNIAARRGLFALAKAKNINVENDLKMSISSSGYYSLIRKTRQTTESLISAYVADMKMVLNEKVQPEIYIWLLENKGTL